MRRRISIGDRSITYTLRRRRGFRALRLAAYPDGSVVLTMPFGVSGTFIERFIRGKASWLSSVVTRQDPDAYLRHREAARALVVERVAHFCQAYGFTAGRISIRNQRTRWGSCSRRGDLSFNYRLALLPAHLADYVVVHEVCHLGEHNHSPKFWALVARTVPDYRGARAELKRRGIGGAPATP